MPKASPLSAIITAANVNELTRQEALVEDMAPIPGRPGRARRKPDRVKGDRAYHSPLRDRLKARGIQIDLARRNTSDGSGLGKTRRVAERTIAWQHQFRRLKTRYERLLRTHLAFLIIGCAIIRWRFLGREQWSFCYMRGAPRPRQARHRTLWLGRVT
jgi:IS5 family transposase